MSEKLWLNLGCSDDLREGFVNVDIHEPKLIKEGCEFKWADIAIFWPWKDSTVDFILANDIIEHLPDKIYTMNNAWRVLKPGGVMDITVPTTDGPGAWQDPTHVSFWNRNSFKYYEKWNPYRERFAEAYKIRAAFKIVKENITDTIDGPKLRIVLEAVK